MPRSVSSPGPASGAAELPGQSSTRRQRWSCCSSGSTAGVDEVAREPRAETTRNGAVKRMPGDRDARARGPDAPALRRARPGRSWRAPARRSPHAHPRGSDHRARRVRARCGHRRGGLRLRAAQPGRARLLGNGHDAGDSRDTRRRQRRGHRRPPRRCRGRQERPGVHRRRQRELASANIQPGTYTAALAHVGKERARVDPRSGIARPGQRRRWSPKAPPSSTSPHVWPRRCARPCSPCAR